MGRPHQFCARAASRSSRDTRGLEPGAFFIENLKWSPDAKWAGFSFQVVHSSLVAQPAISRSAAPARGRRPDRKSTRLNSSHGYISYAVFCLKKKKKKQPTTPSLSPYTCDCHDS